MEKTRTLVITSLLITLTVILTRFLSINTSFLRLSLEFLPINVASVLLGPIIGGITGSIADIIGATLFPSGAFFPGFTLSAFITGIIYGLILYKNQITVLRTVIAVFIKVIIVDFILVTIWLIIIFKVPLEALLAARLFKCGIIVPIEIILIYFIVKPIKKFYKQEYGDSLK